MSYETYQFKKHSLLAAKLSESSHRLFWSLEAEQRQDLITIHRYAATLHRIAENDCNGHPRLKVEYRDGKRYEYHVEDEAWAARDAKKDASFTAKIEAIANKNGWRVQFQGDPRGAVVKLQIDDKDATDIIFA